MSFSEDVLLTKLMAVNETQESIVKISQWILFHRRYAGQAAKVWFKYLTQAPDNRKLGLFYLANEIVQQSRAKKKDEFVNAFGEVFPDAVGQTYKHLPASTQSKIRRLLDVLRNRSVFSESTISAIESQISGTSSTGGTLKRGGGNAFSGGTLGISSIPSQLTTLSSLQRTETDASASTEVGLKKTLAEYSGLFDSDTLPAPPVYNSKLTALISQMNSSEASVASLLTTRRGLVGELKRLLETNESLVKKAEDQLKDLKEKKQHALETKEELTSLLVGSDEPESNTPAETPPAPEVEELTPPATDAFTPPAAPEPEPPAVSYNDDVDDSIAPSYSPLSSDEEDEDEEDSKPLAKKQKVNDIPPLNSTDLEGLDPAVAAFLSNIVPQ